MMPRKEVALKAEAALAELILFGKRGRMIWPDEERVLEAALAVIRRLTK